MKQHRWVFDKGISHFHKLPYVSLDREYRNEETGKWRASFDHYTLLLTREWRLKDLGFEEHQYDGYHRAFSIPFLTFSWYGW